VDAGMLSRLEAAERDLDEVMLRLADPEVVADQRTYRDLARRHAELTALVDLFRSWRQADEDAREAQAMAGDDLELAADLTALGEERQAEAARMEESLRSALLPRHKDEGRPVIIEIRAAAGGDEAAIWAGDLSRMYQRYAESRGLTVETLESHPSESGGFSRVTLGIGGKDAFGRLRFEAGVHRVQRVPRTESQGRVHTSTATVAVLPEVEESDIDLSPDEVRVDVFRSTGPGGQSVNTTDSAVRLTHIPTGIVVSCQDEKSQLQNKEKAFRILRARLRQVEEERRHAELSGARRSQIGSGDRSEKIRTYNYKENRVTDHRIGLTLKRLSDVLEGDLDPLVDALVLADQDRRLAVEG
jgi:peptide chain release factor 1